MAVQAFKKDVTFVSRIFNFSGIRSQSWQIRQNDGFQKNEKKIEKLTKQVIFFDYSRITSHE